MARVLADLPKPELGQAAAPGNAGAGVDPAEPGKQKLRWSDLRARVISALILTPLVLFCLWFGGWLWILVVVACGLVLADEWRRMAARRPGVPFLLAGVACILPGAASMIWLRADPLVGVGNLLFVLFTVWASDVGAYATGRIIGGPRLAPAISPGKTWSGSLGGVIWAMAIGLIAGQSVWAMLVAVFLALVSQAGDLLESAIKRHAGVKDSGSLIPGHGGLLDRLDGILAAAPVAALIVAAVGRGVQIWR